jgi:type I restriction enzyme R subunit
VVFLFDQPPLTRKERAENVRKRDYFSKYGDIVQKVLVALLDKYETEGITSIEKGSILKIAPLTKSGSPASAGEGF